MPVLAAEARKHRRIHADSANSSGCSGQDTYFSITLPDPLRRGCERGLVRHDVSGSVSIIFREARRAAAKLTVDRSNVDRSNSAEMLLNTCLNS